MSDLKTNADIEHGRDVMRVLEGTAAVNWGPVAVIGYDEEGNLRSFATVMSSPSLLWLAEQLRLYALQPPEPVEPEPTVPNLREPGDGGAPCA